MFAGPDVLHFFTHKLARLRGSRFAFALVPAGPLDWFLFRHNKNASLPAMISDVRKRQAAAIPGGTGGLDRFCFRFLHR